MKIKIINGGKDDVEIIKEVTEAEYRFLCKIAIELNEKGSKTFAPTLLIEKL